jgi:hypothetical protein
MAFDLLRTQKPQVRIMIFIIMWRVWQFFSRKGEYDPGIYYFIIIQSLQKFYLMGHIQGGIHFF